MADEYGPNSEVPVFKLMVVGNTGVGKTCLILRFVENTYIEDHKSTLGVEFKSKTIDVDSKAVKLQIWDFAGSDRFVSISKSRLEEAHGIIIVFDITNQESFQDLERHWGQELAKHKLKPGVARILVANKVDLADRRVVDPNSAKQVAEEYGGKYIETSAKMSTNVNQMFETIARDIFVEWQKNQKPDHWREEEKKSSKRKCILQ